MDQKNKLVDDQELAVRNVLSLVAGLAPPYQAVVTAPPLSLFVFGVSFVIVSYRFAS